MMEKSNNINKSKGLPIEIGEYKLRQMHLNNVVVLEYSKEAVMMRHAVPNSVSKERVKKNLLIDVKCPSFSLAVSEMREKLNDLPGEVKEQFVFGDSGGLNTL